MHVLGRGDSPVRDGLVPLRLKRLAGLEGALAVPELGDLGDRRRLHHELGEAVRNELGATLLQQRPGIQGYGLGGGLKSRLLRTWLGAFCGPKRSLPTKAAMQVRASGAASDEPPVLS